MSRPTASLHTGTPATGAVCEFRLGTQGAPRGLTTAAGCEYKVNVCLQPPPRRFAMAPPLSRRTFLQLGTAAAAASYVSRALPASAAAEEGSVAINPPSSTFPYSDVPFRYRRTN